MYNNPKEFIQIYHNINEDSDFAYINNGCDLAINKIYLI